MSLNNRFVLIWGDMNEIFSGFICNMHLADTIQSFGLCPLLARNIVTENKIIWHLIKCNVREMYGVQSLSRQSYCHEGDKTKRTFVWLTKDRICGSRSRCNYFIMRWRQVNFLSHAILCDRLHLSEVSLLCLFWPGVLIGCATNMRLPINWRFILPTHISHLLRSRLIIQDE